MGQSIATKLAFPESIIPRGETAALQDIRELQYGGGDKFYCSVVEPEKKIQNTNTVVLYCHGNGENIYTIDKVLRHHATHFGATFVCFDWLGYGQSTGKASEKTLNKCAELVLDYITTNMAALQNVVVFGRSIGTVAATHLAHLPRFHGIKCLILQSPVASAFDVAFENASVRFMNSLLSVEKIQGVRTKIVIVHGDQDEVVPFRNAEALLKASEHVEQIAYREVPGKQNLQVALSSGHTTLWKICGAHHNDIDSWYRDELRWCLDPAIVQ